MNAIFEYAGKPFQSQVGYNGQAIGNAISMGFTYGNYTDLDLEVGASVLTPVAISARDEIIQLYLDMKAEMTLVNQVLNSQFGSYTAPITKAVFSNFTEAVNYNNQIITDPINGVTGCYVDPINCLNITANINSQLIPIDMGIIDNLLDTFEIGYQLVLSIDVLRGSIPIPVNYIPIGDNLFLPVDGVNLSSGGSGVTWLLSQQSFSNQNNHIILQSLTGFIFGLCIAGGNAEFPVCGYLLSPSLMDLGNVSLPWQETIGGLILIELSASTIDSEIF